MRYTVLKIETHRPLGRYTRPLVSWQVVDVDAGLNERNYPKRIIASCAEEGAAEQIAAHFNGAYAKIRDAAAGRTLGDPLHEYIARLEKSNAELRKALEASHREYAAARSYWANQGPFEHVVLSLHGYNNLVKERDEALAKYAAAVDTVSLVDG